MLIEKTASAIQSMQAELEAIAMLQQLFIPEQQRRRAANTLFVTLWYTIDGHDFISYVNANKYLFPRNFAANLSQCLNLVAQFDYNAQILARKSLNSSSLIQTEIISGILKKEESLPSGLFFSSQLGSVSFEKTTYDSPHLIELLSTESFEKLIDEHPLNLIPSEEQAAAIMRVAQEYLDYLVAGQQCIHEFYPLLLQWGVANSETLKNLRALKGACDSDISLTEFFTNNLQVNASEFTATYSEYQRRLQDFAMAALGFYKHQISNCYDKDAVSTPEMVTTTHALAKAKFS